jgi:hypothetical protein
MEAMKRLRAVNMWRVVVVVAAIAGAAVCAGAQQTDGQRGVGDFAAGLGPNGRAVAGIVQEVHVDGMVIETQDNQKWTITAGPNTRVLHERDPMSWNDLKAGYGVFAAGQADAAKPYTLHAVLISYRNAEEVRKQMEGLGKEWVAGKILAMDGTKITVNRPDNVKQTILVDENTSFKSGGDSITLADIHVGDGLMAKGGLQDGTFVAKELRVRHGGGARRDGAGAPAGAPMTGSGSTAPAANEQAPGVAK